MPAVIAIIVLLALRAAAAAAVEAQTWTFDPPRDEFSDQAALDLRGLNEREAGEHGFVRLSADGESFVLGDGTPARFWAVNDTPAFVTPKQRPPLRDGPWPTDPERNARFLAKRGVNLARCFVNLSASGTDIAVPDRDEVDVLWRMVAAMKKQGIYTLLTPYWALASRVHAGEGIPSNGAAGKKPSPAGLLFFDPTLRSAYKSWMKAALAEKNPYTGIPLAQDPALAVIQLQNEDGLLWWTVNAAAGGESGRELSQQFAAWLARKPGGFAAATARWDGAAVKGDDLAAQRPAIMPIYDLFQVGAGGSGMDARRSDQLEFITGTMRSFNQDIIAYLRDELGCKQLLCANNWTTADNVRLGDCQRYADAPAEVIGLNRYLQGVHHDAQGGRTEGWAIMPGDFFADTSALTDPLSFPLAVKQVEHHPFVITEGLWMPPLTHRSESPFLVAAYSSLIGLDGFCWFATGEEGWAHPRSANGYVASQSVYACATPMVVGQWPAAALLLRKGYVRQGEPVVRERRSAEDLYRMRAPIIAERRGSDPLRDKEVLAPTSSITTPVDQHAFLAGPVSVMYDADPSTSTVAKDLGRLIDPGKGEARSITGELVWNWKEGVCTLDAPMAQGACGFLGQRGTIALRDLSITCRNPYASVLAVPLDGQPLASSARILVQVGTTERPTGWATRPSVRKERNGQEIPGEEVTDVGKPPWQVELADLTIAIADPRLAKLRTLDANLMESACVELGHARGGVEFTFPKDALYALLTAE